VNHSKKDRVNEFQPPSIGQVFAHPALNSSFKLMQEGVELASQKSVRAERDPKVFEREATFRKPRGLEDSVFQAVTNTTEIYKGFCCINMKT
jgi:hypothetical protein